MIMLLRLHEWREKEKGSAMADIIRSNRKTISAEIKHGELMIRAPQWATDEEIECFMQRHKRWIKTHLARAQEQQKAAENHPGLTREELRALAQKAAEVIARRAAYYAPLVGVTYGKITIRNQRSRWGSCSSKGNLNFNCLLMLAPPEVLDSVVVHELCHRKEMNHSDRFYAEVLRVLPDYWASHQWLKEHGAVLLAMLDG